MPARELRLITTSFSARALNSWRSPRHACASISVRSSMAYCPSRMAVSALCQSVRGMSVMKPSRPRLMPTTGTCSGASVRATPSIVPSPPTTSARSALCPAAWIRRTLRLVWVITWMPRWLSQASISSRMRPSSPSVCGRLNSAMVLKEALMVRGTCEERPEWTCRPVAGRGAWHIPAALQSLVHHPLPA